MHLELLNMLDYDLETLIYFSWLLLLILFYFWELIEMNIKQSSNFFFLKHIIDFILILKMKLSASLISKAF